MAQCDQTYEGDEENEDVLLRGCYFERPSTADQAEEGVRHALLITSVVMWSDVLSSPRLSAGKNKSLQKEALCMNDIIIFTFVASWLYKKGCAYN